MKNEKLIKNLFYYVIKYYVIKFSGILKLIDPNSARLKIFYKYLFELGMSNNGSVQVNINL